MYFYNKISNDCNNILFYGSYLASLLVWTFEIFTVFWYLISAMTIILKCMSLLSFLFARNQSAGIKRLFFFFFSSGRELIKRL